MMEPGPIVVPCVAGPIVITPLPGGGLVALRQGDAVHVLDLDDVDELLADLLAQLTRATAVDG